MFWVTLDTGEAHREEACEGIKCDKIDLNYALISYLAFACNCMVVFVVCWHLVVVDI